MKTYTNIKQARSDLRKLTEMYQYIKDKKEELNATLSSDSSYDKRAKAFAYRLALNEMQKNIREIKKNIKKLDTEIAEKHLQEINKNIQESKEKVITNDKKECSKEHQKDIMNKIQKTSKFIDENTRKKDIYDLLVELKKLSEAFNKMGGYLYSSICADKMNIILDKLKKYQVEVNYYQWAPGRVSFTNLQSLIEKYEESGE